MLCKGSKAQKIFKFKVQFIYLQLQICTLDKSNVVNPSTELSSLSFWWHREPWLINADNVQRFHGIF